VETDHASAERRSLELHRLVAERLRRDPALLERARGRVRGWIGHGTVSRHWAEAWDALLARPLPDILAVLVDPGQRARDLRQNSPFAGVLSPRERWDALRRLREPSERP
jgi:hypothetical protein